MNPTTIAAFYDELEKIAYGPEEHQKLVDTAAGGMSKEPSNFIRRTMKKSTVSADKGIRSPAAPWSDPIHSFGGSQTRQQLGQNVAKRQQEAVRDIANSIGDRSLKGRILSGARAQRGVSEVGLANHQLTDISSHNDTIKPSRLRKITPKVGYGGKWSALREHARGEFVPGHVNPPKSKIDELDPSKESTRQATSRSAGQGRAVRRQVEQRLIQERGMNQQQAAAEAEKFFSKAHAPSLPSRALGEASRTSRYVKGEVRRAVGTPVRLLRRIIHR
jgi:hypothetical protein